MIFPYSNTQKLLHDLTRLPGKRKSAKRRWWSLTPLKTKDDANRLSLSSSSVRGAHRKMISTRGKGSSAWPVYPSFALYNRGSLTEVAKGMKTVSLTGWGNTEDRVEQ